MSPLVAGVDEVGRGCLFGPVVAAAVILPDASLPLLLKAGLTDSKKLTALDRERLDQQIRFVALTWAVGSASVVEIDRINILQASLLAMARAIAQLEPQPAHCLIDGNQRVPELPMPQTTIIKGDRDSPMIAAASIVAKVWRDQLLTQLALEYPGYDLAANKGYGTRKHRAAIARQGLTPLHRRSFKPCQLDLLQPLAGSEDGSK
ncbi:ribonuclease HII [Leptolyngbya sp. FACHB-261]|uniref:ribonuclease HII n=1 Tax=Leptolyngbya sp. FACHB-261 TaxID=2692806 RepID=UPI0016893326|nr:ribonuclease HII [Leptolyngbya sp. FACHB-261]MBD2100703.1 ribonuclease HII [Leptolyngbya sp. FACHB-261]